MPTASHTSPSSRRLIALVRWYQRGVDGRPSPCRFTPSCSAYAIEALHEHGAGRGVVLALWRMVRCRPFGPSGFDPVPPCTVTGSPRLAPRTWVATPATRTLMSRKDA